MAEIAKMTVGNGNTSAAANQISAAEPGVMAATPLTINAQYIKDLSFENPNAPRSLLPNQQAPNVDVNIDVQAAQPDENFYEVSLTLSVDAKRDEQPVFMVELTYAGLFSLGEVAEKMRGPLLLIEAPRHLFPFARQIIADATRDGGFPPLLINPIDFVALYRKRADALASEATHSGSPE